MKTAAKILILVITTILAATESLHCGPVRYREAIYVQPDGSTFNVKVRGDEWTKIRTTLDGCVISQDEMGWWCYGVYDSEGNLTCSEYHIGKKVPAEIAAGSRYIPYEVLRQRAAAYKSLRDIKNARALKSQHEALRTKGESGITQKRGIAILAQFQDTKFSYTKEDFQNLLNQKGYKGTGSAKDYYQEQFGENWEFTFDVSDIITLPNNVKYYGANSQTDGEDIRPAELVRDACKEADKVIDFSLYDQDGDKEVDNIYVFMAGHDEAENTDQPDLIWSHQWYVYDGAGIRLTCDGVLINRYACSSELSGVKNLTGIGTFCHEYAHTFGLPDFYDTDYDEDGAWAAGLWRRTSLMDGGNYNNNSATPPNLNCIERKLLGLSEPIVLTANKSYELEPIHKAGQYYILETKTAGEYFLLECRSNEGWDKYIGGSGMLAYHIDENATEYVKGYGQVSKWERNTINNIPSHQCADLIEADQRTDDITHVAFPFQNIRGIFFPQTKATSITAKNTPGFKLWDGTTPQLSIMGISTLGKNIRFSVIEGEELPVIPDITGFNYQAFPDAIFISFKAGGELTPDRAIIEWRKEGETEYQKAEITSDKKVYSCLINKLETDNTLYDIKIRFEAFGVAGDSFNTQIMTKRSPAVTWPYFYLTDGGNIVKTEGFIAHVVNSEKAVLQEWFLDGKELTISTGGVLYPEHSGRLSCILTWEDGSSDTIIKEITINE